MTAPAWTAIHTILPINLYPRRRRKGNIHSHSECSAPCWPEETDFVSASQSYREVSRDRRKQSKAEVIRERVFGRYFLAAMSSADASWTGSTGSRSMSSSGWLRCGSFVRYLSARRLFDDIIPWEQGALDPGGDDEWRLRSGWRRSADGLSLLAFFRRIHVLWNCLRGEN